MARGEMEQKVIRIGKHVVRSPLLPPSSYSPCPSAIALSVALPALFPLPLPRVSPSPCPTPPCHPTLPHQTCRTCWGPPQETNASIMRALCVHYACPRWSIMRALCVPPLASCVGAFGRKAALFTRIPHLRGSIMHALRVPPLEHYACIMRAPVGS